MKANIILEVVTTTFDEEYGLEDYVKDQLEPQVKVLSIKVTVK